MKKSANFEKVLAGCANKYHSVINSINSTIIVLDSQHRILEFNRQAENLYSAKRSEVFGQNYIELFLPAAIRNSVAEDFKKALTTEAGLSFETEVKKGGEEARTILWSVSRIVNDEGEPAAVIASGQDVTSRKRIEDQLKDSERKFKAISQVLGHGVYVLNKNKKLIYINAEGERLLGWKKEELVGKEPHPVFHYKKIDGSYYPQGECPIVKVIETGQSFQTDNEAFVRKDGTVFPVAYSATPLIEDGEVTGSVNVFEDISERRATELKLAKEKEFTSSLTQGLSEGFTVLDQDGRLISANKAFEQLTGFSQEELFGNKPPFKYWAEEDYPAIYEAFRKTLEGQAGEYELIFKKKSGERFTALISPRITTDPDGNTMFFATIKDITERKRSQELIEREKEFTSNLIQGLTEGLVVLDADGALVRINDTMLEMTGFSREELIGTGPPLKYWAEESYEKINHIFKRIRSGDRGEWEVVFKKKSGDRFVAIVSPRQTTDPEGKTIFFSTVKDITNRKKAEEELARYKFILENAGEDFYLVRTDGSLAYVNKATANSLGYSIDELLKMKIQDIDQIFDDKIMREHFNELREKKIIHPFETVQNRKNGETVQKEITTVYLVIGGEEYICAFGRDITERKKNEESLRENENKFRAVIEQSIDGISMGTPDGKVIIYNKAMERISGYSMEEVNRHGWFDLTFPDEKERAQAIEAAMKAIKGELPYAEVLITRKDGKKRWVSFKVAPITLAGKTYNLGITSDIHNIKQAEKKLRENEEKYRKLIELANDAIFIADAETGILIDANRKAAELIGKPVDEIVGMHQSELHPSEEAERYKQIFMEAVKTGKVITEDLLVVRKDGTRVPVEISANITEVAGQRVAQGIFRDITERKAAEERLRLFSTAVEAAADGIQLTDMEGKLLYSNKSVKRMFGYDPGEDRFAGEMNADPGFAEKVILPTLRSKGHWAGEALVKHNDGHAFPIYLSTSAVNDKEGRAIALLGVMRDITAQKQFEHDQRRAKELSDALNDLNNSINTTLNINQILQQVIAKARKAMGSESAGIALKEEEGWHLKYGCKLPKGLLGRHLTDREARLALLAAESRKAIISNDSFNDPRVNIEVMKESGIKSFMAVPLTVRDEILGILYFFNHSEPVPFEGMQLDFANRLVASISLSLENARLYEAERNIADTLQKSILTLPKALPGIDFGYLYRSATETAMVGGDFYDLFEIEHNKIGIIVGDVSGKGLGAATLTSLIKNTMKAYAYSEFGVDEILKRTNNIITRDSAPSIFATVFLAILDTKTGTLTFSNAGHPPPVIKTANTAYFLENGNTAIGGFLDLKYTVNTHKIASGDLLLVYTDGVIEARKDKEFYGDYRLIKLVASLKQQKTENIPRIIYDEINRFSNGKLTDDIAILTLSPK